MIAHQESMIASAVLKAQTKRNGLAGPSQLTSEKLKILISTPIISMARRFRVTAAFSQPKSLMLVSPSPYRTSRGHSRQVGRNTGARGRLARQVSRSSEPYFGGSLF